MTSPSVKLMGSPPTLMYAESLYCAHEPVSPRQWASPRREAERFVGDSGPRANSPDRASWRWCPI